MAGRRRTILAAILWVGVLVGAAGLGVPCSETATFRGSLYALQHRLEFPGGAHLMLRREYRAMFRSLMTWSEGRLLERAYLASRFKRAEGVPIA